MPPRIFHALLISLVLMVLTACGTNATRRDEGGSSRQLAEQGAQYRLNLQRDYADTSLVEVAKLAAGMDTFQPDLALEILYSLESIPSDRLKALIDQQTLAPELTEWLELALQIRAVVISGYPGSSAAREWASDQHGHLVKQSDFSALVASYRARFPVPARVAVLLPANGPLSSAAKAIRDGIMSAYLDQPGDSVIRFYASGQSSESAIAAYQQALDDGAMQIIGPLRIDSTRMIGNLAGVTTPVLLLNDKAPASNAPGDSAPGIAGETDGAGIVNSLSLSATEEAAVIAARALSQGQTEAIVMVPDNAWGKRIEAAFRTAFEQGDGQIVASARFNTKISDHSAMLTRLLKIDASRQRKSDLQSWLGVPLSFAPTRRHDFDFIFMVANPIEGRELKPLLRFHGAGDVPVYAMGRIFSGRLNRASDQDLNGIVFPATRWQLQTLDNSTHARERINLASVRGGAYGNLYALGLDAWRLLPWLPLLRKDPDLWFPGEVGTLKLQADGSFYREPAWAQFSAGEPMAFQWPHAGDMQ